MSWNDAYQRIRAKLHRRAFSYQSVFCTSNGEIGTAAQVVLKDLWHYCYGGKPTLKVSPITGQTDPYAMAFAEGRRDVLNRICAMCHLSQEQIDRLAHSRSNDE